MENELLQEHVVREDVELRDNTSQKSFGDACRLMAAIFDVAKKSLTAECPPDNPAQAISSYALAVHHITPNIDWQISMASSTSTIQVVAYSLMLVKEHFLAIGEDALYGVLPSDPGTKGLEGVILVSSWVDPSVAFIAQL